MSDDTTAPLKVGGLELLADSFLWQGSVEYPYSAVTNLRRYARRTSVNLIPVSHSVQIGITIGGSLELQVGNSGLPFTGGKVEKAFQALANSTFQYRALGYLEQLDEQGYFEYGGAAFDRDGDVRCSKLTANMKTAGFLWEPFELLIKPAGAGLFGKKLTISTLVDPDVFVYLIHQLYRIRLPHPNGGHYFS